MELTNDQIKAYSARCVAAGNSPLARLCVRAVTGDMRARVRVAAIMDGRADPGPAGSAMTPRQFTEALHAAGINATTEMQCPGGPPLPAGQLPGGRYWLLSDEADCDMPDSEDDLMPAELHLQVYDPEGEPVAIFSAVTAPEALAAIRAARHTHV